MRSKENSNNYEINEITIIYDYYKSKDIKIDDNKEVKKELGETISSEKLFGEIFIKNNKNKCWKKEEKFSYLPN